jgi:translation initiation factor 2 beta subunit (eIF-2beta)/eIF-5
MTPQEIAKILQANNEMLLKKFRKVIREELEMALDSLSMPVTSAPSRTSMRESSNSNVDIESLRKKLYEKHAPAFQEVQIEREDAKTLMENFVDTDNPDRKLQADPKTVNQFFKDYGALIE